MSRRIDIKFKLETPEEMDKRRYLRKLYRLFIGIFVINLFLLVFLIGKHYGFLPEFSKVAKTAEKQKKATKKPEKSKSKGIVLTEQMPIYHTGQSIPGAEVSQYRTPLDPL